jgi:hypothetical protein
VAKSLPDDALWERIWRLPPPKAAPLLATTAHFVRTLWGRSRRWRGPSNRPRLRLTEEAPIPAAAEAYQTRRGLAMESIPHTSPGPLAGAGRESRIRPGLLLLRDALERARELKHDPWEFAVNIRQLRAAGLTNTDLRWLVCKGYAEHALEGISAGAGRRSFLKLASLALPERTCFVLTAQGFLLAGRRRSGGLQPPGISSGGWSGSGNPLTRGE